MQGGPAQGPLRYNGQQSPFCRCPAPAFTSCMNKVLLSSVAALLCSTVLLPVHAELADRTKPMNVEADSMQYDDLNKISRFTGRVVATKGTIILRAGNVEVRQDAQGNQSMVAVAEGKGKPAFMRQKREGLNEFFEGEGGRIERDEKSQITRLIGNAKLRRLVGSTLADEVVGDTIVYNEVTETYNVIGGPSTAVGGPATGAVPAGRVRAVIVPVGPGGTRVVPGGKAAAPAATASARSTTTLRPSPAIGSGR